MISRATGDEASSPRGPSSPPPEGRKAWMRRSHDINTLVQDDVSLERFAHLSKLLIKHGSDKSGNHGCYSLEARILSGLRARKSIPEISMGSNTLDVVSNMEVSGRPGAS
jgi:hypothetical protein